MANPQKKQSGNSSAEWRTCIEPKAGAEYQKTIDRSEPFACSNKSAGQYV